MTIDRSNLLARSGNAALLAAVALALGAGCMGTIGDQGGPLGGGGASSGGGSGGGSGTSSGAGGSSGGGTSAQNAPTSFTCDPSTKGPVEQLRALSRVQVENTLSDLASWSLHDPTGGATVLSEIASALAALPANLPVVPQTDPVVAAMFPDGGYFREDQDQQYARVQAYYGIGTAIGAALTKSSRLATVVGSCATDGNASNDAACLASFIASFGARALRRPLTSDDVAFYTQVYGSDPTADPAAYADVVSVMVQSPDFLYLVEHGDQPAPGAPTGVYTLGAYELAARLSYHVWDTMPDDDLWGAAQDGSLLQDAVYRKEADRLFADPRARAALDRFFADYLQTNGTGGIMGHGGLNYRTPAAYVGNPVYQALAGSDLPGPSLGQDMVDDAVGMLDYLVWTKPGTVHDLLTSELSFAKSAALAKIYGVAPWDGTSAPPALPAGQRPGLFTRALFLAGGVDTNPILKGVFLRRYALCDSVGKPPAAAANATIDLSPDQTTRQVVTELTKNAPCSGCHPTWINPLGFVTESFDGLGRFRSAQTLFNPDGTVAGTQPVDTSATPRVDMGDETTTVKGVADLMPLVEQSHKVEACLARNYFRYTFARFEDVTLDGCALEAMRTALDPSAGPAHLADLFEAVVFAPAFKQRTFD